MQDQSRRASLLNAYEEFTRKESFCLKERNVEKALDLQAKKAKLLVDLQRLDEIEPLSEMERPEFQHRIQVLMQIEHENECSIEELKRGNREQLQRSKAVVKSAVGVKKAYGSPPVDSRSPGSLKGKA